MPVEETATGTQIFSSKDICLIEYIDKLIEAGVDAFKIEGRMKSMFYVSSVVRTYKEAVETYLADPDGFRVNHDWVNELNCVSHREYSTGFLFDEPQDAAQVKDSAVINKVKFLASVEEIKDDNTCLVSVRNKIKLGQNVEIFSPERENDVVDKVISMTDEKGESLEVVNPNAVIWLKFENAKVLPNSLIRAALNDGQA